MAEVATTPAVLAELKFPPSHRANVNKGYSLDATTAAGRSSQSQAEWRATHMIEQNQQIKLVRLAHMRYQHPNLDEATAFLQDFGMSLVKQTEGARWFAGHGPDPYCYYAQKGPKKFLGATFVVESELELEKVSQLSGASSIEELQNAPGHGRMVSMVDPEGFPINFIWGQTWKEPELISERLLFNDEVIKTRTGAYQRFEKGPAAVYKLGHFGLTVTIDVFSSLSDWYCRTFNIVPTDYLYIDVPPSGDRQLVGAFFHIDRGTDYVDHHTFFMTSHNSKHVHHASYEVHDIDAQQLGHDWLVEKGYVSVWGVGRHILGSQIFDYWWDPTGFMIEHYADGDLVNNMTPISILPAKDESLAIWGPVVPQWFFH